MKNRERKISGEWGLGRWLLLGVFGIALAVAIALAAGSLASQPIGLSGEPVSAGSALEPSQGKLPAIEVKTDKSGQRKGSTGDNSSSTGTVDPPAIAPPPTAPPVTVPPQNAPPVPSGTPDDSVTNSAPESNSSEAGESEGGHADDD